MSVYSVLYQSCGESINCVSSEVLLQNTCWEYLTMCCDCPSVTQHFSSPCCSSPTFPILLPHDLQLLCSTVHTHVKWLLGTVKAYSY